MSAVTFKMIAKSISATKPKDSYGTYDEHPILLALCDAYLRCNPSEDILLDIESEEEAIQVCGKLYGWYKNRYSRNAENGNEEKKPPKSNRGITKNVNHKNTFDDTASYSVRHIQEDGKKKLVKESQYKTYYFNEPYRKEQFERYLVNLEIPPRDEDYLGFILHVSVAFFLKPDELDILLKQCGFQQLHVRNIHHLAIYATLVDSWERGDYRDISYNPFAKVKELYEQAREILNDSEESAADHLGGIKDETRWIREYLFKNGNLTTENFSNIVRGYKKSFTMTHHQILEDHHKFASLFSVIYDPSSNLADSSWSSAAEEFSLYRFTNRFCNSHSSRRDFEKKLFDHINIEKKQPTRELMILFWIYAYCFTAITDVSITNEKTFNKIKRKLTKYNSQWSRTIADYYDNANGLAYGGQFDVAGFIYSGENFGITRTGCFDGSKLIAAINEILTSRYEWARLNAKRPFDYCIMNILKDLKIVAFDPNPESTTTGKIYYKGQVVENTCKRIESVPYPLCVISAILEELSSIEKYPLACKLYVQL